jgi:hypothetical protein
MSPSRAKTKPAKRLPKKSSKGPRRSTRAAESEELVIPVPRQSRDALEADCPPGREPSPEELRELEASVQIEQAREAHLGLARGYPRTDLPLVKPLTDALKAVPGLKAVRARVLAQSLKQLTDKAHDLEEIIDRILEEKHSPGEIAELVLAFQLVTELLSSYADVMGDQLYDLFDRAKGLKP